MDRIIAVRVQDSAKGRLITAFTKRDKNRKAVWSTLIQDKSLGAALVEVERWERQRELKAEE